MPSNPQTSPGIVAANDEQASQFANAACSFASCFVEMISVVLALPLLPSGKLCSPTMMFTLARLSGKQRRALNSSGHFRANFRSGTVVRSSVQQCRKTHVCQEASTGMHQSLACMLGFRTAAAVALSFRPGSRQHASSLQHLRGLLQSESFILSLRFLRRREAIRSWER